jgi:hypothetical protein
VSEELEQCEKQDIIEKAPALGPFSTAESYSDMVFVVEGQKIYFTKALLVMCSPVFERMFNGDFAESCKKEIVLTGKTYADFVVFLQLIHPATAHSASVTGTTKSTVFNSVHTI